MNRVPSCFLSYGRGDDEPFVERLRDRLEQAGVDVWWDRLAMRSRGVSFLTEIDDAIRSVDRVVFVAGPASIGSAFVAHELAVADERCTTLVPVLRLGTFEDLPEPLRRLHVFDLREDDERQLSQLIVTMSEPPPPLGPLIGEIRAPPSRLIERTADVRDVVAALMVDVHDPVVIAGGVSPATIVGMGGLGKTVLASLVGRACIVRRRFADGIVFVRLGPGRSQLEVTQLARRALGDVPDAADTEAEAAAALNRLLASKRHLVILDDAWSPNQLAPVAAAVHATGSRLLVTSRQTAVASGLGANVHELDLPSRDEAIGLLESWVDGGGPLEGAAAVIDRCGRLPLALDVCGALLSRGVTVDDLVAALDAAELEVLDLELPGYEHPGVFAAVEVSVRWLRMHDADLETRYRLLAAFDTVDAVPLSVVYRLWHATSEAEQRAARRQLSDLASASLLDEVTGETIALHDIHRAYLLATGTDVAPLRRSLLDTYGDSPAAWIDAAAAEPWLRAHLFAYLRSAGAVGEAAALLAEETADGRNAWYELRAGAGELDGYWTDLEVVETGIDGTDPPAGVRLGARLVTIRSSIRALVSNTPGNLVVAAVQTGVWPVQRAIAQLGRMDDASERARTMIELLPQVERADWIAELFSALSDVPERDWDELLPRLERRLAPEHRRDAADGMLGTLDRLGPELTHRQVIQATPLLEPQDLAAALAIVGRIVDPDRRLVAEAALTRLLDEQAAVSEVRDLLERTSNLVAHAEIVGAAARREPSRIDELVKIVFAEAIDGLERRDPSAVVAGQRLLPVLRDAEAAATATDERILAAMFAYTSPFEMMKMLAGAAANPNLESVLVAAGRTIEPSIYGVAVLAAVLAESHRRGDRLQAEVTSRLEAAIDEARSRADWDVLGDVAPYLGPILSRLPVPMRDEVVHALADVAPVMAARALAGLAPGLTAPELAGELDRQLARLERASSFRDIREPLSTLAPLMSRGRVEVALELAGAARDDGFEMSWLGTLVRYLDDETRERAHLWVVERSAEHLRAAEVVGDSFVKESDFASLTVDLVRASASPATLHLLEEVARTLTEPRLRAPALAALASAQPEPAGDSLWSHAETLARDLSDVREAALVVSRLASIADGARRARYVTWALDLESELDNDVWRAQVLEALPDAPAVSERAVALVRNGHVRDVITRRLAERVAPSALVEIYEDSLRWHLSDLRDGRIPVARRLAQGGFVDQALDACTSDAAWVRQGCIDAIADHLPRDRVDELLREWPQSAALLARRAELGDGPGALAVARSLEPGVGRFTAVVRCCAHLDDPLEEEPLLDVVEDLRLADSVDELWRCLQVGAPQLARLRPEPRARACLAVLRILGERIRLQALPGLYLTAPLIHAVAGSEGVAAVFDAVVDAGRWWPSYPRGR